MTIRGYARRIPLWAALLIVGVSAPLVFVVLVVMLALVVRAL